jgi:acetyl esterase/lipase
MTEVVSTYAFDPELVDLVAMVADMPPLTDPVQSRERTRQLIPMMNAGVDTAGLDVDDRVIPGPEGAPDVAVRVYAPVDRTSPVPAVLYIHGGGFFGGSIDLEHGGAVKTARELGVVVVSVEYRLAPEDPFPAGLEDCYAALTWLHKSAGELGVDAGRIAVSGGSAGGGLTAGLTLLARDRGGPPIAFQCLMIPELDDRLDTPSMQRFTDTPMWYRAAAERSWRWYLGDAYGSGDVSPYAAPARATDLAGLPPAYVTTMEFDPLRDEGIVYALRLLQAGVSVELHTFPGTFHGSGMAADAAVTRRETAERLVALRRGLGL